EVPRGLPRGVGGRRERPRSIRGGGPPPARLRTGEGRSGGGADRAAPRAGRGEAPFLRGAMDSPPRPDRTVRRLHRALAGRCRGKTIILGPRGTGLAAVIRKRGLEVAERELPAGGPVAPAGGGPVVEGT